MLPIPQDKSWNPSIAYIRDPYRFISRRCERFGSDLFQTNILFEQTICMTGAEAAEIFCDARRFVRQGAMPARFEKTLFGRGGVLGLDGEAHRHRKQMFMSLMTPGEIARFAGMHTERWRAFSKKWETQRRLVLYDEVCEMLTRDACAWAGVPLEEREIKQRTRQMKAMFDDLSRIGLKHYLSRLARKRAEQWMEGIVEKTRSGQINVPKESALHVVAFHRDLEGKLLPANVAAVEMLNVVRPTVAVSAFMVFAAHALHENPECREKLRSSADDYAHWFAQEVRRFYPFFPTLVARVKSDFEWKGYTFGKGTPVFLDLYGINHDARLWESPEKFRPERFRNGNGSAFNFIAQGPGDHHANHRCPGEFVTIELMEVAAKFLSREISYDVPRQDLQIDFSRMPGVPRSQMLIENVRRIG